MTQEALTEEFNTICGPLYRLCYLLSGNRVQTASLIRRLFETRIASGKSFEGEEDMALWYALQLTKLGTDSREATLAPGQDILPDLLRALPRQQKLLLFLSDGMEIPLANISRTMNLSTSQARREIYLARKAGELKRGELKTILQPIAPSPDERKQLLYAILERWPMAEKRLHARKRQEKRIALGLGILVIGVLALLLLRRPAKIQPGIYDSELIPEYRQVVEIYRMAAGKRWKAGAYQEKGLSPLVSISSDSGKYGYFLRDLNGDGTQELLFTVDSQLGAIYTLSRGIPTVVLSADGEYHLSENNAILKTRKEGQRIHYTFLRQVGSSLVEENRLQYDPEGEPSPWRIGFDGSYASTDQATQLLEQYASAAPAIQKLME